MECLCLSASCFLSCLPYLTPARCSMERLPPVGVPQVHASTPLQQQLCSLNVAVSCCDVELREQRRSKDHIRQFALCVKYYVRFQTISSPPVESRMLVVPIGPFIWWNPYFGGNKQSTPGLSISTSTFQLINVCLNKKSPYCLFSV